MVDLLKAHKQAAVIGIGPGQYGPYALNNKPDPALGKNGWPIVNNETLELLLELGVVGLSLVVFYVLIMLFTAIRSLPQKELLVGATVLGLIGYLMAEAVQYQSVSTLYITHIWAALGLLMGILLQADSFKKKLKKS